MPFVLAVLILVATTMVASAGPCERVVRDIDRIVSQTLRAGGNVSARLNEPIDECLAQNLPTATRDQCVDSRQRAATWPRAERRHADPYLAEQCRALLAAPAPPAVAPPSIATPSIAPQRTPGPAAPAPVLRERRVALVIGNGRYRAAPRLDMPGNDAEGVAAALRASGFAVVEVQRDLTREGMLRALNAFADVATGADWAVVYFAGHGIEVGGMNYLIPVDARLMIDRDVADEAIALERVLQTVAGARQLRLIILDACRDNPFVPNMRRALAGRSIGRGLAPISEPPSGTVIAYAARAGQIALDQAGASARNSPFANALIRRLGEPGLEIGFFFRRIRDDVMAATGERQEPFTSLSLPGQQLYFRAPQAARQ
jgi:hypothetical protein